jgi:bifunctional non-homologous end joining protein LigD
MIDCPIRPMLATSAQPFDSDAHEFEVKWDGVRALAAVTTDRWQLWGRGCTDYTGRYPELEVLRRLPAGTVVDGELVVLRQGLPHLHTLLRRHALVGPEQIRHAGRHLPVRYVLFDLLALRGHSLLAESLSRRRTGLEELVHGLAEPVLGFSAGVIGPGQEFFADVVRQGHEGVVAKQRTSRYSPGKRSPAWQKIKPVRVLPCVIVGYTADEQGVRCLLVATVCQGCLRYAATLTRGVEGRWRAALAQRLARLRRSEPLVSCPQPAVWVEPELYCRVRFRRRTQDGRLQDAAFGGLLESDPLVGESASASP